MTTIAYNYKDKQIAVDSRMTLDSLIMTDCSNKVIINDIGIWFLCGAACDSDSLVVLKNNDSVDPIPECTALLIKDNQVFYVLVNNDGYCCYTKIDCNFAIGSGCDFAMSSMDHGKIASEAVEYAMTRDVYTGGKVHIYNVG